MTDANVAWHLLAWLICLALVVWLIAHYLTHQRRNRYIGKPRAGIVSNWPITGKPPQNRYW